MYSSKIPRAANSEEVRHKKTINPKAVVARNVVAFRWLLSAGQTREQGQKIHVLCDDR